MFKHTDLWKACQAVVPHEVHEIKLLTVYAVPQYQNFFNAVFLDKYKMRHYLR